MTRRKSRHATWALAYTAFLRSVVLLLFAAVNTAGWIVVGMLFTDDHPGLLTVIAPLAALSAWMTFELTRQASARHMAYATELLSRRQHVLLAAERRESDTEGGS